LAHVQHAATSIADVLTSRRAHWLLAATLCALYTAISVNRHRQMLSTGFDLGIFEQAIRGYAELRAPTAELKGPGFNLLGDHFHPVLVAMAPVYRVMPSPVTLLVTQAALIAVSVIPVTRLATARLGRRIALTVGIAYGLSWGLMHAVQFDFHEICVAVALLAFSGEALARRRWMPAVAWALPLLFVKEDLPATVTVIGCYLFLAGRRRLGLVVAATGVAVGMVVVVAILPALSYWDHYTYLDAVRTTHQDGLGRLLLQPCKLHTVLALLAPTGFVALRSPLLVIAVPTLIWRFWSTTPTIGQPTSITTRC
jgi:uncharacterized membrane protein